MKILQKIQRIFYQCDCACAENKDIEIEIRKKNRHIQKGKYKNEKTIRVK